MPHIPVLLNEVLKILDPKPGEFFIDGTAGGGGHTGAILERVGSGGRVLGIDFDPDAIERLKSGKFKNSDNVILVNGNYADAREILSEKNLGKADGLLLDLGFSSMQIEGSGKGFSFQRDEPLDMRYDQNSDRSTAEEVVNSFGEKELADIIFKFGEERMSRRIAKAIVERRRKARIRNTLELAEVIKGAVPRNYERGRIHPATRTFQAMRIYVNDELQNVEKALSEMPNILKSGARAAVISFHSLEDRIVKNGLRDMQKQNILEILTKKPIVASDEETRENPRSRSAKLRGAKII